MILPTFEFMKLLGVPKLVFYNETSDSFTTDDVSYITKFYFNMSEISAIEALDIKEEEEYENNKDCKDLTELTLLYLKGCEDPHTLAMSVEDFINLLKDNQELTDTKTTNGISQWPLSTN